MLQAKMDLRQRQEAILTPRLQQSLKLLQMSMPEFQQAVQHALATNPFLDDPGEVNNIETLVDEGLPSHYPTAPHNGVSQDPLLNTTAGVSLQEHLLQALGTLSLSKRDYLLAITIIDSLEEDGYLRQSLVSLSEQHILRPKATLSEWRAALHRVQQLLAPGIAARDLRECLILQLRFPVSGDKEPDSDAARQLAVNIVQHHLEDLGNNDWPKLKTALQANNAMLAQACKMIRRLDPKPGLLYDSSPVAYAIPDVVVDKHRTKWRVRLNEAAMPKACLQTQYIAYLRYATGNSRALLRSELQEARWLLHNLEQRYTTILRVAEAIVTRQHRFLDHGDVALRPLTLRELAQDIDVHESTVSRATDGKYMLTPRGLFEFRHFFSRELATAAQGTCSATAVRALIKELVGDEDSSQPLSDVALARRLAENGIVVARRTVTKYRNQLKIPAVDARKKHY